MDDDRGELARFLRLHRERLAPEQVGLPGTSSRRRTPGLRREEVAMLAGLSVTHYARIEQARGARPSAQVLGALARALRLSRDERGYLFHLARQAPPGADSRVPAAVVPDGVLRLLDLLHDTPAMVMNLRMDVLAWNPLAARLLVDFGELLPEQRNMVRLTFLHPPLRSRFTDLDSVWRESVASLRSVLPALDGDPGLALLVGELTLASEDFRRHWNRREVRQKGRGSKGFQHPDVGLLTLDYEALQMSDGLLLVVYSATTGTPARAALDALAAAPVALPG